MPRIVQTDNFGRSGEQCGFDERFVFVIPGTEMVELKKLRAKCTDNSPFWYKVVPDDYKLAVFEP